MTHAKKHMKVKLTCVFLCQTEQITLVCGPITDTSSSTYYFLKCVISIQRTMQKTKTNKTNKTAFLMSLITYKLLGDCKPKNLKQESSSFFTKAKFGIRI